MRTFLCVAFLLPLSGCGSIVDYTGEFELGDAPMISTVEAADSDQRVKIEVTAGGPVNVIVMLSEDVTDATTFAAQSGKKPEKALGASLKSETASFEVSVPAGKEFQIITGQSGGEKVNVTLKANSI